MNLNAEEWGGSNKFVHIPYQPNKWNMFGSFLAEDFYKCFAL